jgi:hypothetical protein
LAGNLQHKAGITARGWQHNNINTKLKIFSTRLASQQEAGNTTTSTLLPPYTHLGDVEEIFNPLGVSLGASES